MNKKVLTYAAVAGLILLLLAGGTALYYWYTTRPAPPPQLVFASDRAGAGDIFAMAADGSLQNLTQHPSSDWSPAWSPDGRSLAFTSHRSGNSDIWLLDMTPHPEQTPPEPRNLTLHPAWDYSAAWSPSGQSVVFVSERDGDPEIFVQSVDSDTALQLTFNEEMDRLPAWSPDGKMIAFAAVRQGIETIHLVRPDGTAEQIATPPPLQGTAPAWSPDGRRLAFVGWDEENRAGIYTIGPDTETVQQLYQGRGWLGSLHWSTDGRWITFTAWDSGNHEVYALPLEGGAPKRLTIDEAWDDWLILNPLHSFDPPGSQSIAQAASLRQVPPREGLATGVNLADLGTAYLINDMGFGWGKGYVNWGTVEPQPSEFRWVDPDNITSAFGDQNVNILMRVHGTPAWARPENSSYTHPPNNVEDFAAFMTALATRYKGQVAAYEIWNEPNLYYEWGNKPPNPAQYTDLLKAAYTAVKAVDPEALVISGGLSTTGEGSATAQGDLEFLQEMYEAGAKGYFDALGSHPYTFGRSPAEVDPWGLSLSRVTEQRAVMLAYDDADTPIWITELGWAIQNSWDMGEHQNTTVTELEQAQYLLDAYQQIEQEWPYVHAVFLFNLDFSTVSWYPANEPMRWYAILNPDRTPRPAYSTLRQEMRRR